MRLTHLLPAALAALLLAPPTVRADDTEDAVMRRLELYETETARLTQPADTQPAGTQPTDTQPTDTTAPSTSPQCTAEGDTEQKAETK